MKNKVITLFSIMQVTLSVLVLQPLFQVRYYPQHPSLEQS
jgi:hypothetical protein